MNKVHAHGAVPQGCLLAVRPAVWLHPRMNSSVIPHTWEKGIKTIEVELAAACFICNPVHIQENVCRLSHPAPDTIYTILPEAILETTEKVLVIQGKPGCLIWM